MEWKNKVTWITVQNETNMNDTYQLLMKLPRKTTCIVKWGERINIDNIQPMGRIIVDFRDSRWETLDMKVLMKRLLSSCSEKQTRIMVLAGGTWEEVLDIGNEHYPAADTIVRCSNGGPKKTWMKTYLRPPAQD